MRLSEAVDLIGPAVERAGGTWADFGAGTGLFTRALAERVGPAGRILAVDRDPRALARLRDSLRAPTEPGPEVLPIVGDFRDPAALPALAGVRLQGALFANSLHFVADPAPVLAAVARLLSADGRLVVVEYEGRPASPWVPYPLPGERLRTLAARAGLGAPRRVGERPSAYGGAMYCAVLERKGG